MAQNASFDSKVLVDDAGTLDAGGTEVKHLSDASAPRERSMLDVSGIDKEYTERLAGMEDLSFSMEGFIDPQDAGQLKLIEKFMDQKPIVVTYQQDPTVNDKIYFEGKVSSFEVSADGDSPVTFSAEVMISNGSDVKSTT